MPFRHIRSNGSDRKLYVGCVRMKPAVPPLFPRPAKRRTSHRNASPRVSLAFVRMERVRAACTTVTVACADMFLADRHIFFVGSGPFVLRAADGGVRRTCRRATGTVRAGGRFSLYFADHRPCRHRRHNDDAKHDHKYINGSHIVIPCRLRPGCRPRCPPPPSRRRSPHRPPPRV